MKKIVLERIMISKEQVAKTESEIRFHEHLRRYAAVRRFCYGKVLDFASGCGYGSHILSSNPDVDLVIGVDKDADAINWAEKEFNGVKNQFKCVDIESVHEKFDTLVSLEAIEHFEDKTLIPRLADRCGIDHIVISYPNKKSTHFNPYHVHDFNAQTILDMMSEYVCYHSFVMGDVQFLLFLRKPLKAPSSIFSNIIDLKG
ncbi:MAG: class I SAM-dependent methyltransferase [Methylotenera sp.]|nr:class I SAM-dependent methyltransferase [Methylotenera sp.]MDP3094278.1 class I SAM-dependent methyltransferase [Methylotenera sp.]MDZ4223969.1 class I SAM-dependent methyltransferase [Methylotenera sp.]